jgi:predicted dienelactone hydrolase
MRTPQVRARVCALVAACAALAAPLALGAGPAAANPFAKGPDPTLASVEATTGPFATASQSVARGNGFGGGVLHYPTSTTDGTFAAIAICPGYTRNESSINWYGKRLASQGFVVLTMNTNSTLDFPASRGKQLLAALDWMRNLSPVKAKIDPNRLGVMGQSMGGGGTLEASKSRPSLKGAFATAPWNTTKTWSTNTVPQMLMGMENDSTAPPSQHAIRFYDSLPATLPKIYAELRGASHTAPTSPNTTIARYAISWMKRWLDEDTRYSQFLCPAPLVGAGTPLSRFSSTCPF